MPKFDKEILNLDLEKIVYGCKMGKTSAREALYMQYYRLVFSVCYRYMSNVEEAKDLTNDVFIKVFQKIQGYEFTGSFEGWLKRVSVTTCIDYIRMYKKDKLFVEIDICPEVYVHPEEVNESKLDIQKLLGFLPKMEKAVLSLFCIEGYSHKEIAGLLEISEGHSRWLLHQGRNLLKKMVEPAANVAKMKQ